MTRIMAALIAAFAIVAILPSQAEARHHYRHHHYQHRHVDRMPIIAWQQTTSTYMAGNEDSRYEKPHKSSRARYSRHTHSRVASGGENVIGGRPSGCPHAYCGCEASRFIFNRIIPELNLAANWIRKFPHTSPAPGMAAARSHHVMVLMSHVEGQNWLVHDGNSGHGLTREHVRSISGYVIVDPHGARYASR